MRASVPDETREVFPADGAWTMRDRAAREQQAYNDGGVFQQSRCLQERFPHVFFCPNTLRGEAFFTSTLRKKTRDATVLEYGCYDGTLSGQLAAWEPKRLVGIDISDRAIAEAKRKHSDVAEFHVMDGHHLDFGDKSFDLIVGRAILHHLDCAAALGEIHRVLKAGGVALFIEPLGANPGAKFIRWLSPRTRTPDEVPLSRDQIRLGDELFGSSDHVFVNLASVPLAMLTSLVLAKANNLLTRLADRVDTRVAKTGMRYWMRQVVLCWTKVALGSGKSESRR